MEARGYEERIGSLEAAVAALEARLEALAAQGAAPPAKAPAMPPSEGGPALGRVTVVTGLRYSSSSGSAGWTAALFADTRDIFAHLGPSSSSSQPSSSSAIVEFVPEEI